MKMNDPFNRQPSPDSQATAPIIRIGEERSRLAKKLEEYKKRLEKETIGPDSPQKRDWDTIYKIAVAQKLVEKGEVNTHDLSDELNAQYGFLSLRYFNNACAVINDYITTGGKMNEGGTGLPE